MLKIDRMNNQNIKKCDAIAPNGKRLIAFEVKRMYIPNENHSANCLTKYNARIKKDHLWKPLLRGFRTFVRELFYQLKPTLRSKLIEFEDF